MLLRQLYIQLDSDPGEFPWDLVLAVGTRTCYLTEFVQRRMRKLRFKADGFSKISILGSRRVDGSCPIVPENAAQVRVPFDQTRFESLGESEHHEFFIDMLCHGLELCNRHHRIPVEDLQSFIDEFRASGYKNEWIHQTKLLRRNSCRATLACSLTEERFVLTLRVDQRGRIVFEEDILETEPDEMIFAPQFKEVAFDGTRVLVKDRLGIPIFSVRLVELVRKREGS